MSGSEMGLASVWARLEARVRSRLEIDEGRIDVAAKALSGSALGTAVCAESHAVNLVLLDMNTDALRYFKLIRRLALLGYERNEVYVYSDPDGTNAFGKYMAMRIAALAEWVLGGAERSRYLDEMMKQLQRVVQSEVAKAQRRGLGSEVVGCYTMHLAQLGAWERLTDLQAGYPKKRQGLHPWASLERVLVDLAEAKLQLDSGAEEKASEKLDDLFRRLTDAERIGEPYDTRLTANDIVTVAEIRGRCCYGESDPSRIIKSIRWPGAVGASPE